MCDICRLVTDDVDGGLFMTSQPTCSKGRALAAAHHVEITFLLPPSSDETQWNAWASPDDDEVTS